MSIPAIVALTGGLFLIWPPILLVWVRRPRYVKLRFHEAGRAEGTPVAVVVGGDEEPVEVLSSALVEQDGARLRRFRLRAADEVFDVSAPEDAARWRVERELPADIVGLPAP